MDKFRKEIMDERRKAIVSGIPANDINWLFRNTGVTTSDLHPLDAKQKRDLLIEHWDDAESDIFTWLDGARND